MTTINSLELRIEPIHEIWLNVQKLIDFKGGLKVSGDDVKKAIKLHFPKFEREVRLFLEACTTHTEEFGHSERADSLKDRAFHWLGKCVNDDI